MCIVQRLTVVSLTQSQNIKCHIRKFWSLSIIDPLPPEGAGREGKKMKLGFSQPKLFLSLSTWLFLIRWSWGLRWPLVHNRDRLPWGDPPEESTWRRGEDQGRMVMQASGWKSHEQRGKSTHSAKHWLSFLLEALGRRPAWESPWVGMPGYAWGRRRRTSWLNVEVVEAKGFRGEKLERGESQWVGAGRYLGKK